LEEGRDVTQKHEGAAHPRYAGCVIDAHCHFDASTRRYVDQLNFAYGLDWSLNLWDVSTPPNSFEKDCAEWRSVRSLRRCYVPNLKVAISPASEKTLAAEMTKARRLGAVGVKVWKELGLWLRDDRDRRVAVDDERLEPLWSWAGALDLPVTIHVGDPPAFFAPMNDENPRVRELRKHPEWWWGGADYPSLRQINEEFEHLVALYPKTKFIGAHFGCFMPSWMEVRRMLDAYPNYYVDTAAAVADLGGGDVDIVRDIFLRHSKRILFGTDLIRTSRFDMPDNDRWRLEEFFGRHWRFFETADVGLEHPLPAQGAWSVAGLDLPNEVLDRLYWSNASMVYGHGSVAVDREG